MQTERVECVCAENSGIIEIIAATDHMNEIPG